MQVIMSLLLLLTFSSATYSQTARISRIEIVEYGIYQVARQGATAAPGLASGTLASIGESKLVTKTTAIPTRMGMSFGFRYKILGSPDKAKVTLKDTTLFPAPGLRNPSTGNRYLREEVTVQKAVGDTSYTGYTLDHEWELVPGTWTIELWDGDRKLATQSFTLVKP